MADRIYQDWEAKLKSLLDSVEKELEEVRAQKEALFSLNTDVQNKIEGRLIHDDRRLILSAPEIVIGNVNMGGTLDPAGGCTIIIRGNNVAVEGVGNAGSVAVRAPMISQTAENPGIDGKEHTVEGVSQVIIQSREVSIDSNDIPAGGAFLDARTVGGGSGIALHADKRMSLSATSSKKSLTARLEEKIKSLKAAKEPLKKEAQKDLDNFKKQGEELSKFNDKRDKLRLIDEDELTSSYHDIDELNVLISDLTPQLVADLYRQSKSLGELAELNRQEKFFTKMKEEVGKTSDDDFKKKPVPSSMSIQSEFLSIVNADGDGNLRTDEGSGVTILSNRMKVEGVFDDKGSLDKGNRLTVNMKTIDLSTAGRSGVEKEEDGTLKAAKLPAEGDVIITSKNITMQTIDAEVADKKYKDTGLAKDGSITIRSKSIGLSNINTTDVEADDKGKVTKATYKPEGEILLFSKQVQISSMESKLDGDKVEETALAKDSVFSVRAEKMSLSAADHEGKAVGHECRSEDEEVQGGGPGWQHRGLCREADGGGQERPGHPRRGDRTADEYEETAGERQGDHGSEAGRQEPADAQWRQYRPLWRQGYHLWRHYRQGPHLPARLGRQARSEERLQVIEHLRRCLRRHEGHIDSQFEDRDEEGGCRREQGGPRRRCGH